MSGFKIEKDNVLVEYFGTSNSLKLSITSEDFSENNEKEYYTEHIWVEPNGKELDNVISALQEVKKLL